MRYVLLLFFVFLTGLGFSQRIQIEGVEVNYSSHYPDRTAVCYPVRPRPERFRKGR